MSTARSIVRTRINIWVIRAPNENKSQPGDAVAADAPHVTQPTPLKNKYGPNQAFTSEDRSFGAIRKQLDREMKDCWLDAMPVEEFFEKFLRPADEPLPEIKEDPFKPVPESGLESLRYAPFITVIEDWIPNFRAVNTSTKEDTVNNLRLKTNSSRVELWIYFNTKGVAFQDPPEEESDESDRFAIEDGLFTPDTDDGNDAHGQLAHYPGAQYGKQFRNFSFSVLVEGKYARFLRWEPGSVTVTVVFNYREKPRLMAEFFWRFSHLSALERGHDTTVQPAKLSSEVHGAMKERLWIKDHRISLFRYTVPGRLTDRGYAHKLRLPRNDRSMWSLGNSRVICISNVDESIAAASATGEGTTTDEPEDQFLQGKLIFMKDTWLYLSDKPGVIKLLEHEAYEILHSHKIPNTLEHAISGDIGGSRTRAQEFLNAPWLRAMKPRISAMQHYRLAHVTIGRELTKFGSTKELVIAVCHALEAHWHAFERVKILHRDISVGNIILTDKGQGLLIDWEMAKFLNGDIASRRPERTGTWQFMSANLQMEPGRLHTYADDLESFLHVLAWITLRYVPAVNLYSPAERRDDLRMFDEYSVQGGMDHGGYYKSGAMCTGQYPSRTFYPQHSTPIFKLVQKLHRPFGSLYTQITGLDVSISDSEYSTVMREHEADVSRRNKAVSRLESSAFFIEAIQKALKKGNWPDNDKADESLQIANPDNIPYYKLQHI